MSRACFPHRPVFLRTRTWGVGWLVVLALTAGRANGAEAETARAVRSALHKALPLIEQSAAFTLRERTCFTCHHGAHAAHAVNAAWARGLKINRDTADRQLERAYQDLVQEVPRFKAGYSVSQTVDGPAHALWMLEVSGWKPNVVASAAVDFFLKENADLDHWVAPMHRPPTVGSPFTTTFLVLRALQDQGTPAQRERIEVRTQAARKWLVSTPGRDTEDRVYRVRALALLGERVTLGVAVADLLGTQQPDGGWGQAAELGSDAYATGTALAALVDSGALPVTAPAYLGGVGFLLRTQGADGSWLVRKRTHAVQPFFHSDFPHGQDQFIAFSATCWAAYALVKTLPLSGAGRTGTYVAGRSALQAQLR